MPTFLFGRFDASERSPDRLPAVHLAGLCRSLDQAFRHAEARWVEDGMDGYTVIRFADDCKLDAVWAMVRGPQGWPAWRLLEGVTHHGMWPKVGTEVPHPKLGSGFSARLGGPPLNRRDREVLRRGHGPGAESAVGSVASASSGTSRVEGASEDG